MKKITFVFLVGLLAVSCGQTTKKQAETMVKNQENPLAQANTIKPVSEDSLFKQIYDQEEQFDSILKPQNINLYDLLNLEYNIKRKVGFISLSDNYPLSEHPDSLAIPDLSKIKDREYFKLNSKYRERFLAKTKTSETDTVFIYDYSANVLLSFPVKDLNVTAYSDVYNDPDECNPLSDRYRGYPCNQDDYMIGFEISKNHLKGLSEDFDDALVYVGKENPFVQGQMEPIVWKKINSKDFPLAKASFQTANIPKGDTYLYESSEFQYFLQNLLRINRTEVWARHLLVIDKKSKKATVERILGSGEGTEVLPLNFGIENKEDADYKGQWTGKLFKNKPPVVLGFESVSFGCPRITVLDPKEGDIYLNCDNRN